MPYIKKEDREQIDPSLNDLLAKIPKIGDDKGIMPVGWINYMISRIIHQYLLDNHVSYTSLNAMVGVLECSKLELYRVIASIYEEDKIKLNGRISDLDTLFNKPDETC